MSLAVDFPTEPLDMDFVNWNPVLLRTGDYIVMKHHLDEIGVALDEIAPLIENKDVSLFERFESNHYRFIKVHKNGKFQAINMDSEFQKSLSIDDVVFVVRKHSTFKEWAFTEQKNDTYWIKEGVNGNPLYVPPSEKTKKQSEWFDSAYHGKISGFVDFYKVAKKHDHDRFTPYTYREKYETYSDKDSNYYANFQKRNTITKTEWIWGNVMLTNSVPSIWATCPSLRLFPLILNATF